MDCDTEFKQLKHALVYAIILAIPNFNANFVVETNAGDKEFGAVLMQHNWPVAFISKALNYAQYKYHNSDGELLVIVLGCKKQHLLSGYQKRLLC